MTENKSKNNSKISGYILLESIICIIIFSISCTVVSSFLERVYFIEKLQNSTRKVDENYFYIIDDIEKLIYQRNKTNFTYKGITSNLYINNNKILFKIDDLFYEIYWKNNKIYVSTSVTLGLTGNAKKIAYYDNLEINSHNNKLYFNIKFKNESILKIISLN